MKKQFFSFLAVAALLLTAVSCSQDEYENGVSGNTVDVTFTASLDKAGAATRAISDGLTAVDLYVAVYNNGKLLSDLSKDYTKAFVNREAIVSMHLVKGQTYKFLFWAQNPNCNAYTLDKDAQTITVNYEGYANDESRDAFYATKEITVAGPTNLEVTLDRPFAQLNIGTTEEDCARAKAAGVDVAAIKSTIEVANVPSVFSPFKTGAEQVSTPVKVSFTKALVPDPETETLEVVLKEGEAATPYKYLSMNYLLADAAQSANFDVKATIQPASGNAIELSIPNVPLQGDWRTNILGNILTDEANFNIIIDQKFDGDHNRPSTDAEKLLFAALNGGTVTLNGNVTLTETLNVTAAMILDLNGYTLNGSLNVSKDATLAVDGGKIENTDKTVSAITSNGSLTLNNVEITSARHALRIESGTVVINGGTYKVAPVSNSTLHALNVGDDNTVAVVTIKGGTFVGPKGTIADSGTAVAVKSGSKVTIEAGNFSGGKNSTISNKGEMTINGGIFDQQPNSEWIADGYQVIQKDAVYAVVANDATVELVATTSELQSALTSYNALIILADDVDMSKINTTLVIEGKKTLDLGGHELTTAATYGGITVKNGGSIKNGTINHTSTVAAVKAWQAESIENVTIKVTPISGKVIGGIVLQAGADTYINSIKNVTISGTTNGIETYNCGWTGRENLVIGSMENVNIDATDTGILLSAPVGTAKNCNIKGTNYGINMHLKGEFTVAITLEDCDVTGGTAALWAHDEKGIDNHNNCSLTLTYDAKTVFNGNFVWDFEEECKEVVTLNAPQ